MEKWGHREFRLPENHGWRAKPGNKIFVANRGAVQFEFPADWVVSPGPHSIRIFDDHEPDDEIRLEVSVIELRPGVEWGDLPLGAVLDHIVDTEERDVTARGAARESKRPGLEAIWLQIDFTDPNENRKAHSRLCLARSADVQTFITMDFWQEDRSKVNSVWKDVLGTLKLGERIDDPTLRSRMN